MKKKFFKAAEKGNLSVLKSFVEHKRCNINIRDETGSTALIWASCEGHLEVVKYLVEKGADLEAKDNEGWTALMLASYYDRLEIVKVLKNPSHYQLRGRLEPSMNKVQKNSNIF